ncbi:hypothetical protein [Candidatus Chloroploca asiatica]|nr:hypothetical protein [Candidatus Chloroploca asiatica]
MDIDAHFERMTRTWMRTTRTPMRAAHAQRRFLLQNRNGCVAGQQR